MTSARSAGPRSRLCSLMLPKVALLVSWSQPSGMFVQVTGAGRNPPSVPIWIMSGPASAGSGTPPGRASGVGQPAGQPLPAKGSVLTSLPYPGVPEA